MDNICKIENKTIKFPAGILCNGEYIFVPIEKNEISIFPAEQFGDTMNDMLKSVKTDATQLARYMLSHSTLVTVSNNVAICPENLKEYLTSKSLMLTSNGNYFLMN